MFSVAVVVSVLLLAASACSDSGSAKASATSSTAVPASAAPQRGGVITIGEFSAPPGLDPAKLAGGTASVGGMEFAAIYDTLVRLDPASGNYEPHTAQSLTANSDHSQWTLKLKANIKFTDGTDYNADAVKFSVEREMTQGNAQLAVPLKNAIDSVTVVDPLTVVYKLKIGWAGFPYLLAGVGGMVYSQAAVQKAGANFDVAPGGAGAGPFEVSSYKPGEALELQRNPTYYGGEVYLDGLRFVLFNGADATYQALKTNALQAAWIRDPVTIAKAKTEGFNTVDVPTIGGNLMILNSGTFACAAGKPGSACANQPDGTKVQLQTATADVRVRQAVAQAIDPNVINDRVYNGKAVATTSPFHGTPFDPGVQGPKYDVNAAKQLVQQAKAAGWDGKIRVLAGNDPTSSTWALAVSAMLTQAGMDVSTDATKSIADVTTQVLVQHEYDTVNFGLGLSDEADGIYSQLIGAFSSKNPRYGYGTPELDAAIDLFRTADTPDKRKEAAKQVAEILVSQVPALFIANFNQAVVVNAKLHGVERNAQQNAIFDKAWLQK